MGAFRPYGYRIKETTIAIVSKAIVVIKTLWPHRAINPSIFNLPVTESQNTATWERLQFRCINMGVVRYSSTSADVTKSRYSEGNRAFFASSEQFSAPG